MRIALGVEYDGTHYHGFQRQKNVASIQETLEDAISKVASHPIQIICAGRTDAGVHATGQVIHFDTNAKRKDNAWILGVNMYLPDDICIRWQKSVSDNFHARFSALSRTYLYTIDNRTIAPAILRNYHTWHPKPLDESKMQAAAQLLLGEHDFTSFRGSGCQANTPFRCVEMIRVERQEHLILVEIKANAFLHHMVRNIMGVLVEIGSDKQPINWAREVLESKDRKLAGKTMPAQGLCFVFVKYN